MGSPKRGRSKWGRLYAPICSWLLIAGRKEFIMKQEMTWFLASISAGVLIIYPLLIGGCATATSSKTPQSDTAVTAGAPAQPPQAGGAELWGRNCGHCHNIRSPSSYSDAQWEVVMLHMRVRANLTPEEHKKILAFL